MLFWYAYTNSDWKLYLKFLFTFSCYSTPNLERIFSMHANFLLITFTYVHVPGLADSVRAYVCAATGYSAHYARLRCAGVVAAPESLWLLFYCCSSRRARGNTIFFGSPTCTVIVNICLKCQSLALKYIKVAPHFLVFLLLFTWKHTVYGSQCFYAGTVTLIQTYIQVYIYKYSPASIIYECIIQHENFMRILMLCEYLINPKNSMLVIWTFQK